MAETTETPAADEVLEEAVAGPAAEPQIVFNGITLNDFTDVNDMFLIQNVPENMGAASIQSDARARRGSHGSNHGPNYYTRRMFSLAGKIIAPDQATRYEREKSLLRAFSLPRNPKDTSGGFYDIQLIDEGGTVLTAKAKVVAAPKLSKEVAQPHIRDFIVALELQNHFWEGEQQQLAGGERIAGTDFFVDPTFEWVHGAGYLTNLPETTHKLENTGDHGCALFSVIYGAVSQPCVINDTTGEMFKVDMDVGGDERLEIDSENGMVFLIDKDGNQTDMSANITADSQWVFLQPGENEIRIEDTTGMTVDFHGEFFWRSAHL